ncbi:MAG: DUF420 domain-containing protein [Planctomycetaceae bacterium]
MSAESPQNHLPPVKRRTLRLTGALLWFVVAMALLALWWNRASIDAAAQTEQSADEAQQTIRIRQGQDGQFTVESGPPGKSAAIWDPQGVEDFSLTNCDGRTITKQDLRGKPWVIGFTFTHCLTTCPVITKSLRELQDRFKNEDIQLVTLTVDPDRDTEEVLKNYAELNGADLSRWYFLRGDPVTTYGLIHRSFQMPAQMPDAVTGNYQVIHSNNLMLVDQQGVVQGKYLGTNPEDVAKLARDLRHLLHPPTPSVAASVEIPLDAWYMKLPAINAGLNALAGVLLSVGYLLIKQRRVTAHRNVMLTAFLVSILFLACYLVYHDALRRDTGLPGKPFPGVGASLVIYRVILVTHVILAAAVPFLASMTIYRGLKADWARHRKIAKITFPIWMYVSITGVIIYCMLYHWPVA